MKIYPIAFKSRKDKTAHHAWCKAIDIIGGPTIASELSGIRQPTLSTITHGRKIKSKTEAEIYEYHRLQCYPTLEQAIKISLLTGYEVTAEELLPHYDFRYLYEYIKGYKQARL